MTTGGGNEEADSYETDYEHVRHLSLDEVSRRLTVLSTGYEAIKRHYAGPFGILRRNLRPEDLQVLGETVGDLLHLSLNDEVQDQIKSVDPEAADNDLPFFRISSLNSAILLFMGRFENSGVTIIQDETD